MFNSAELLPGKNYETNEYGHPVLRNYERGVCTLVEINKINAELCDWYNPKKQVLFKDGEGLNVRKDNLTQDWNEVVTGKRKRRPVVANVDGNVLIFDSIETCGNYLAIKPLYISQALYRGTNIGGYYIEYYFNTLPGHGIISGVKPDSKGRKFKVEVDGIGFHTFKEAANYLDTPQQTLTKYFAEGRSKLKGHYIKKL